MMKMVSKESIQFLAVAVICSAAKLLLIPAYRSTDFEVHRNWLAVTHSLPLRQWYFDATSPWTLDYPPFFAYFQYALALLAVRVDPGMVQVQEQPYESWRTVVFLRSAVVAVDLLLLLAAWLYLRTTALRHEERLGVFALVALGAGPLVVDHVHFQFNGGLLGLLLLCAHLAATGRHIALAVAFSCLVLLKHLFAPLAPLVAVFLLHNHCCVPGTSQPDKATSQPDTRPTQVCFSVTRFLQLVAVAAVALGVAFGPFAAQLNGGEQLRQMFSRLFPFGRGLVHAYWAPNVWALYCLVDKVCHRLLGGAAGAAASSVSSTVVSAAHSSTSGVVGDFVLHVLPRVSAAHCMALLLLSMLPAVVALHRRPSAGSLLRGLVYASLSAFMLGYHVHEKAVLVPLALQTLLCLEGEAHAVLFLLLAGAGTCGLLPLLIGLPESLFKGSLLLAYLLSAWLLLRRRVEFSAPSRWLLACCGAALGAVFVFAEVAHPLLFAAQTAGGQREVRLPFLPLMLTSVVCALELLIAWGLSLYVVVIHR